MHSVCVELLDSLGTRDFIYVETECGIISTGLVESQENKTTQSQSISSEIVLETDSGERIR